MAAAAVVGSAVAVAVRGDLEAGSLGTETVRIRPHLVSAAVAAVAAVAVAAAVSLFVPEILL